jgi:hypothetical protein
MRSLCLVLCATAACAPTPPPLPVDAGHDAGHPADAGALDAGPTRDAGTPDAGTPDAGTPDAGTPDAGTPDAGLTPGDPTRLLLLGTVVTPLESFEGQVLVEGTRITCVERGTACEADGGALGATRLDTGAIIAPGLIDTHNHILFDVFDDADWAPTRLYRDHNEWTNDVGYHAMLDVKHCLANDSQGKPAWCAQTPYGTAAGSLRCEMDKFGELKGLIAGTTSIVGLPGVGGACFGSLARSIDTSANGLGSDRVRSSALFPPSGATAASVCGGFSDGGVGAFLVHCGEGVDVSALEEFATLGALNGGCLKAPQTTLTHGTAFASNEFTEMATHGMRLTWSPHSNVSLYGDTANIPAAMAAGVQVALGPDWSMGGSQNLLEELRFAQTWDQTHWNGSLTPRDLVLMATVNGAAVVGQAQQLGALAQGYLADLIVVHGDRSNPWQALIDATPREVALVLVGGAAQYGDEAWRATASAPSSCEALPLCGADKFLCMAVPGGANKLGQSWAEVSAALEGAMTAVDAERDAGDGRHYAPLPPLTTCAP